MGEVWNATSNPWLDTGDNAWQLTTATFVGMQSIPGLMVFYAGIVKKKWAINSAFMCFYAFAMTLLVWVAWGYEMSFGEQVAPFLGKPGAVSTLSIVGQLSQAAIPAAPAVFNFPMSTMVYFQFVFCAITLVLIAGSVLGRMNFTAWILFVPLWITLSYATVCFSIWGGGWLFQMGVLDYSGGYVIHVAAGTAAFVAAWFVGPRLPADRENFEPNNIPLMLVGAGLLWLGWNGFNGGDPFNAGPDAGVAVLNTNICTAASLLTWMFIDMAVYKKASVIGAVQGMITGLVAITPAAGLVPGWAAIVMGVCSGAVPWISLNVLGKTKLFTHYVDDTLGVFHTHAVAGILGGLLTGVFATSEGCAAFAAISPGGAIAGNPRQIWLQLVGIFYVVGVNLVMTPIILFAISFIVPLRMSEADLVIGDAACHGEDAYAFFHDGAKQIDLIRTQSELTMAQSLAAASNAELVALK